MLSVPLRSRPYRSAFDLHASHLPLTQAPWKSPPEIHLRWRPLSAIYIHRIWRSQVHTSTGRHWRNSLRNLLPPRLPCCVLFCLRFSLPCVRERRSNRSGNDSRKTASKWAVRRSAGSFAEREPKRTYPPRQAGKVWRRPTRVLKGPRAVSLVIRSQI